MNVGDVVDALVVEIHPFGMYVDASGVRGLILIPEITWGRISSPSDDHAVGDPLTCKVLRRPGDGTPHFIGSVKQARPEENPWHDPSVYTVGETFRGKVVIRTDYGFFVEHERGEVVLLHVEDLGDRAIQLGDEVDVTITEVDVDRQRIRGRPIRDQ